jgi:hypothetical protein
MEQGPAVCSHDGDFWLHTMRHNSMLRRTCGAAGGADAAVATSQQGCGISPRPPLHQPHERREAGSILRQPEGEGAQVRIGSAP